MARNARYDRQTALGKAVHLFWARGYHATSIKQIEQALDMRPGSIYAAFGSKDQLFSEALDAYAHDGNAVLQEVLQADGGIVDGLQKHLRDIANACHPESPEPSKACMLVKTLLEASYTHSSISEQANQLLQGIEASIASALLRARDQGELMPDTDCQRLARLIQAQIMGLRAFAQRETSAQQVSELADDMAALLEPYRATH
ncbi:TetR/AcrR family transcriptional regulator [Marinobacter sp. CHS3-4]|uniref:TetR/AcrR family transcriptional regulator n=1 Tax=Marinobacter sp. CHS3-4 TaxID=3045174 RepID=UPI0024B512E4|nr:TetR/AcrR family transcriptional regulator [Marinobacter sp. CHS3-4]MDI9243689.1 TetR/AcrR family transcriptional regulator [Marinobacter sp. CHS3-4]